MQTSVSYIQQLTRETHKSEPEVLSMAFRVGLRQLWREHVLGRYLRDEISRDEAVETVGSEWVSLAERQQSAVKEDLAWAMGP